LGDFYLKHNYKFKILAFYFVLFIACYLLFFIIYSKLAMNPNFFLASMLILSVESIISMFIFLKKYKNIFNFYEVTITVLFVYFSMIFFAVFGPVFIDRSLSYYIIMAASERGSINIETTETLTSKFIYKKRIDDAVNSGLLTKKSNTEYIPTKKSIVLERILFFIGYCTNSLNDYRIFLKMSSEDKKTDK
jgi:hypothetical protein